MKKFWALMLSAALTAGLCVPALAAGAGPADQRLAAVTQAVKDKLDLDTAGYDQFHGDLTERTPASVWQLSWSGEGGSMDISVTEEGRVLSYSRWSADGDRPVTVGSYGRFGPAFPALERGEALETALAFLDRVLEDGETAAPDRLDGAEQLSASSYSFSGGVLVNGLPSPFRFSVRVDGNNQVSRFSLSGTSYTEIIGDVPDPDPAVGQAEAARKLRGTLDLRLEYVLDGDGRTAVLRYLPNAIHDYYADARTGELVDLTALYSALRTGNGDLNESAMGSLDAGMKNQLTPAELEGVAKLEGVLSREELDAAARKLTALGLDKYTLADAAYTVDRETGDVTARLQYARQVGESYWRRYVTVDGKTGALQAVSSSAWGSEEETAHTVTAAQAMERAEAFLAAQCGGEFARTALYNGDEALAGESRGVSRTFNYTRKENGYFFPANALTVGIDCTDGSVSAYRKNFDWDVTFQSPEGIIGMDAAVDAWLDTYEVRLGYLAAPVKLDPAAPEFRPLIDQGRSCLYTLKLAYTLEREAYVSGIDAHTGAAVLPAREEVEVVSYSDVAGHWVEDMAAKLARYNVGWTGGVMEPDRALTQRDLVALLVSTSGRLYSGEEDADALYAAAYSMGILEESRRDDGALLTRAEMVKLLLDCAGYGSIANIPGIFRCDFADAADIPEEYMGYAALAQGLGLMEGSDGSFLPGDGATRAQAAAMLYRYLDR